MKNPFEEPVPWQWLLANIPDITREQARYAAHAINQHEKLIICLRSLEYEGWLEEDKDGNSIPTCPYCGAVNTGLRGIIHDKECELAALLAAEEAPHE